MVWKASARGMGLFPNLMSTADKIKVVLVEEFLHNVGAESEGDAAVTLAPAICVFVRIRPQQITEQSYGND